MSIFTAGDIFRTKIEKPVKYKSSVCFGLLPAGGAVVAVVVKEWSSLCLCDDLSVDLDVRSPCCTHRRLPADRKESV